MKLVIEIDEARFKDIQRIAGVQLNSNYFQTTEQIIASGRDVLDKIKAEIDQVEINGHIRDVECFRAGLNTASKIIDKYRESEEVDADSN